MAKIGLRNFMFGILTEDETGTPSYGVGQNPGKAISCSVSISNNSATLYADDALTESDTSFQSGTATLVIDRDDVATQAILLGHEYDSSNNSMTRTINDTAPYVGLGRIVTRMVNNQLSYKVEFLNKVKFSEPSQEDTTRGENVEFNTETIEGTVAACGNGQWSSVQVFDTMAAAQTYLKGLFGTQG